MLLAANGETPTCQRDLHCAHAYWQGTIPCHESGVTTNGDECSHVGHKRGGSPSPKYSAQKWTCKRG